MSGPLRDSTLQLPSSVPFRMWTLSAVFNSNPILPPSLPRMPHHLSSVVGVSLLLGNNPTSTNTSSPVSAGAIICRERGTARTNAFQRYTECTNVVYTQTWNYLSVWDERGAEQYYSNHLGWCYGAAFCPCSLLSSWLVSESLCQRCHREAEDAKNK